MREVVTPSFRESLLAEYPGLSKRPGYWRLMLYLLSGGMEDRATGDVVVSAAILAGLDGQEEQNNRRNFRAEKFLASFKATVLPEFSWSDGWSWVESQARTASAAAIDPAVVQAYEAMQSEIVQDEGLVDAVTGNKRTKQHVADDQMARASNVARAFSSLAFVADETRAIVEYQNSRPSQGFTEVVKVRKEEAFQKAESLQNPASRRSAIATIANIVRNPKPLVKPVEDSPRAFSDGQSLLTVKSEIRRVFTNGWVDYDLKAAQLAIIAKDWGITELRETLEAGESIWEQLLKSVCLPVSNKRELKQAVYSLVFGGSKKQIMTALEAGTGVTGVGDKFFGDGLIKRVWKERENRAKALEGTKGATTALGRQVRFPYRSSWKERAVAPRSYLAQQAQSLELMLILPVFELARATGQFSIMLYQFDGFTVKFRDKRNSAKWHREILKVVDVRAKELGIPTRLDWQPGEDFSYPLE